MKKILIFISFFITVIANAQQQNAIESIRKIGNVINAVNNFYVDTVDIAKLSEKAVIAILKNLDPHSTYISKEEFQAMNEPLAGSFEGIGVEFTVMEDTLVIIMPVSGGPSEKVGIMAGDKIVAVDGQNIAGVNITTDKIYKLLRGKKGTKVVIDIVRRNMKDIMTFEVIRDKIPINSVDAAYEVRPGLAYIKLGRFAVTSMDEIIAAFAKFKTNPDALILDIRGNGGGIMGTSVKLADQFLEKGKLIVYTSGTHFPSHADSSTNDGIFEKGKLVLLINEGSASASEIVSGAIQDWDRGILIGRRTFGKGLVQHQLSLGDGSYIRLTISRYHTPTGRAIQRPYEKGNSTKYIQDFYERYANGEMYNSENINFPDSLKYKTLVKGRTVYGGGGIMPDIFIPQDTSFYTQYYAKLINRGITNRFVLNYVSENREKLKTEYPAFEHFEKNFIIDDDFVERLVTFAEKEKLPRNDEELNISKPELKTVLKALCARDLWGTSEYSRILNANVDKEFAKAIEVIDNWQKYEKEIFEKP
ncbi:MAG: PDZ domain-containing protein [Prevotellaceae bacterium]|jgi:carboxyl-terminal processing protease|nr:PDZ domain-containing protein [Prevotellaceae bacterium]